MEKSKLNISNKTGAYSGAVVAVATVFAYSMIVMIYVIIRSSVTIYGIMPEAERNMILLTNDFSVAYSVAIFSLLMATLSSVAGSVAAVILKKSLQYFNPRFNVKKAILISCISALAMLVLTYILFYAFLKALMTFDYVETFLFWFLFPSAFFIAVSMIGGSKLNKILHSGIKEIDHGINKI
jgi:hypothetical protein